MGQHLSLPKKCKSVVVRKGNYRGNCPPYQGRSFSTGRTPWRNQVHHILCEHAITDFDDAMEKEKLGYIKACLCIADWDINEGNNLVGLPLKTVYIRSDGETPTNLTCHNVDHNTADGYTFEVKRWLHDNIWDSLAVSQDKHKVDAKDIKGQLNDCIDHFKTELKNRGERNGGTRSSYKNRFEPDQAKKWYKPFSMSRKPTERSPGGRRKLPIFKTIS